MCSLRVLVVDDEPNMRFVLKEALAEVGHKVSTAANGLAALTTMQSPAPVPDVVLVDLLMPRLNGKEVISAMRADPRLAKVPVVLVTGSAASSHTLPPEHTYQALVTKPFDLWGLMDLVGQLGNGSSQRGRQ